MNDYEMAIELAPPVLAVLWDITAHEVDLALALIEAP